MKRVNKIGYGNRQIAPSGINVIIQMSNNNQKMSKPFTLSIYGNLLSTYSSMQFLNPQMQVNHT